ncbi:MAG TPA: HypC/HybG/HupF family hydrogenase formation chaperone [Candidatus Omnitrophota bacterium]|nr:HypC/HybG/HupF family hydrogenase formation chaperone [Candidatus Omnitrophota bacterium]
MCIAYPMRIDVVDGSVAIVSSGSIKSTVNIQLVKGVKAGDYVLVHAGIAIEKVDKKKAKQILDSLKEIE